MDNFSHFLYYRVKTLVPKKMMLYARRKYVDLKRTHYAGTWPIDPDAAHPPGGWCGWPGEKQFALVLTHDVEINKGQDKCYPLVELEASLGFRSSFNFVAEGYPLRKSLFRYLIEQGFEVGVHGLNHKGNPFRSEKIFMDQVPRINHYLKEWGSVGYRTPSMYHNQKMLHNLEIEYDSSTFDTDPFEPQPDGVKTIFPFWVKNDSGDKGYVELPYTLPQDFTLFALMKKNDINIWKTKLDWIAERGGMALLITHPDYMNFDNKQLKTDEYPAAYYEEFLKYIKSKYTDRYWHVLPKEIARFWASNFVK
jgi:hypothetical protein